jgi:uncharacterized membrane protein YjfL (UPF0719 family)
MNFTDKLVLGYLCFTVLFFPFIGALAKIFQYDSMADMLLWGALVKLGLLILYAVFRRKPILKTLYPETYSNLS